MKPVITAAKCIGASALLVILMLCATAITARYFDSHSLPPMQAADSLVLENVNLISIASDGVSWNRQLVIEDGKISAVLPAGTPVQEFDRVIDARGAFVIPGMFDMHVHIDDRSQLRLALSYGVTSVRNMDGMPIHLRWKQELQNREWVGASLYSASPAVHGEKYSAAVDVVVSDVGDAAALVHRFNREGWDQVKVYSGLGADEFTVMLAESDKLGMAIVGHIPYSIVEADYTLAGSMRTVEHVEEIFQGPLEYTFDEEALSRVTQQLASSGAVVCPTLMTFEHLTRISEDKQEFVNTLDTSFMTPFGRLFRQLIDIDRWLAVTPERAAYNRREMNFLKSIVFQLDRSGVELIAGTDAGTNFVQPGISLSQELVLMHDSGMSTQSILEAATINSARALGLDGTLGTIEVGKQADLVLFRENPLRDISATSAPISVVKQGVMFTAEELTGMRNAARNVAGWWTSTGRYLEAFFFRLWM